MTTKFNLIRDVNGYNGFGLQPCDTIFNGDLAQLVEQTISVPGAHEHYMMIVATDPGLRVYVAYNTTATVPGPILGAATSEINPVGRRVKAGDVIHFITPDVNCNVTVLFYALDENYV